MTELATGSSLLTEGGGTPDEGMAPAAGSQMNGKDGNGASQGQPQAVSPNDWRATLPDDLKDNASLKKYSDVAGVAKAYVSLEQMLGSEKVPVPKSDDDVDGWNRVYTAFGRPEAPDKYDIKRPEIPEDVKGLDYDEGEEKYWRDLAFQNGLSNKQFKNMWDSGVKSRMEKAISMNREWSDQKVKAQDSLKREWGNSYDGNLNTAKTGFRQFADPDFVSYLDETGLGNDPRMTRFMYKVGKAIGGDNRLQGVKPSAQNTSDLDRQINEYRIKYGDALNKEDHPNHDYHVRQFSKLFEARFGE